MISINHCYGVGHNSEDSEVNLTEKCEIPVFGDADENAYCFMAYLHCVKSKRHNIWIWKIHHESERCILDDCGLLD